jgi:hypothetical protein
VQRQRRIGLQRRDFFNETLTLGQGLHDAVVEVIEPMTSGL